MIEYLYDCIRATSDTDTEITARITDDQGNFITENCNLTLYSEKETIITIEGIYTGEGLWEFVIPKDLTVGYIGRYYYSICHNDSNLCFRQPIYFK